MSEEQFRRISSVRELADGRTLALDVFDDLILLFDWTTGTASRVSRKGRGPGEYLEVGRIFPLGRDSSVLEDPTARRWILMAGPALRGPLNDSVRYATDLAFSGIDRSGRYLEVHPFVFAQSRGSRNPHIRDFAESLLVLSVRERGARADTLTTLAGAYRGHAVVTKSVNGRPMTYQFYSRFAAEEQALLFPDGWIALSLRDPYRVDWIDPAGRRVHGKPLPFRRVAVDATQKKDVMDRSWTGRTRDLFRADEMPGWPEVLPPFQRDALVAMPDGRLLVERTLDATESVRRYDVVDRRGSLVSRIQVAKRERIVGFGVGTVFTVLADDDELETLRRHPWR